MHDNVRPEQIALPPPPRAHPRSPTRRQLADALNPYARTATRRAIACITCARAKTRCDKALPSCTRCLIKGIKCDPRSTRRTSHNKHTTAKRLCDALATTSTCPHAPVDGIATSGGGTSILNATVEFNTSPLSTSQIQDFSDMSLLVPMDALPMNAGLLPSHGFVDLVSTAVMEEGDAGMPIGMPTAQPTCFPQPLFGGDDVHQEPACDVWSACTLHSHGLDMDGFCTLEPSRPMAHAPHFWPSASMAVNPAPMAAELPFYFYSASPWLRSDYSSDGCPPDAQQHDWRSFPPHA